MSEPHADEPAKHGPTLERSREELLEAAKPLSPEQNWLIDDLTDDEDRRFLDAILDA